ncbi:hypothetical protein SN11_16850 [Vibrio harveyi]|nr:hypothetical protein SN11_16850 [Vibrio harveyi]
MNSVLDLMGLTTDDFTWYEAGLIDDFVERNLPQIVGELAVNDEPLTVAVTEPDEAAGYDEVVVSFVFRNMFLPVLEDGDFYVKPNGRYATLKRNDGYALLGIRNES